MSDRTIVKPGQLPPATVTLIDSDCRDYADRQLAACTGKLRVRHVRVEIGELAEIKPTMEAADA